MPVRADHSTRRYLLKRIAALALLSGLALPGSQPLYAAGSLTTPADWQGIWRGHYVCNQGTTALILTITAAGRKRITANFAFQAHPGNPRVPSGEFWMSGKPGPEAGRLTLSAGAWIHQPANFVTVDLDGTYDPLTGQYRGVVNGPGCSTFSLQRDLIS